MKYINAAIFPKPVTFSEEVVVGFGSMTINVFLLILSVIITSFAIIQGATSTLKLNGWQWGGLAVTFTILSLFIHELLHAFAHPKFGISHTSKFGYGFVSKIPALWVGYADWMPRKRAIVILLLPFMVLAIFLPIISLLVGNEIGGFLSFVGGANAIISRKDVVTSLTMIKSKSPDIFESERGYFER